ncbi:MAG: hypothetical protein J6K89_08010 [Oscillospiraceae bacterium]|nr:hypothetical protein [Oscillospiraceae bacterium]
MFKILLVIAAVVFVAAVSSAATRKSETQKTLEAAVEAGKEEANRD